MKSWFSHENRQLTEKEKEDMINNAATKYAEFMKILKIDLKDPNAIDTPTRVAKMFVNEFFTGRYDRPPKVTNFPNLEKYNGIVFTNCFVTSICSHHHLSFLSQVFMGVVVPGDKDARIIGLSKYTRIAEWIAARPTMQETMNTQIHNKLNELCVGNLGVMVYIIGSHTCATSRGIKQFNGKMVTSICSGLFREKTHVKNEFMEMIKDAKGN